MDTTVAKGMAVLEALARAKRPLRLAALTEQLGLQKSNVHRLLSTFMELGYVQQEPE
ncbi:helix-turn-helix domain-containing protein, partial [Phenylobacterium sp.]|uniref:helix-turn-helix domain-containing protein n=1 Tax=Phenylobacterium sp. TaxID=1871053 RepID=UPI003BB76E5C